MTKSKALTDFEEWKKIARTIVRYQNFKGELVASRINVDWAFSTKLNYVAAGINYIRTGDTTIYNRTNQRLYQSLRFVLDNEGVIPLRPNKLHQRMTKHSRLNLVNDKTTNTNDTQTELITPDVNIYAEYIIGVKIGDVIHLMDNAHDCDLFAKGVNAAGGSAKVINAVVQK